MRYSRTGVDGAVGRRDFLRTGVAAAIGTNPETLSRCLARLRGGGLLHWTGRDVRVDDELWSRHP